MTPCFPFQVSFRQLSSAPQIWSVAMLSAWGFRAAHTILWFSLTVHPIVICLTRCLAGLTLLLHFCNSWDFRRRFCQGIDIAKLSGLARFSLWIGSSRLFFSVRSQDFSTFWLWRSFLSTLRLSLVPLQSIRLRLQEPLLHSGHPWMSWLGSYSWHHHGISAFSHVFTRRFIVHANRMTDMESPAMIPFSSLYISIHWYENLK